MNKIYYIYDAEGYLISYNYYLQQPENSTAVAITESFVKPKFNGTLWIEGATPEELIAIQSQLLALHKEYPETTTIPYKFIQLDNLEGIERDAALSNKGLKGEKKYFKNETLIFSSQKKYWFEADSVYKEGFIRTLKVFNVLGDVIDSWEVKVKLSDDDKQQFQKQQRELIFDYFKSQQTQLFNFLYAYFAKEINDYVILGGSTLADTLTDAIDNHPAPEVRGTLSSIIPTQSGQEIRVLDGILYELV